METLGISVDDAARTFGVPVGKLRDAVAAGDLTRIPAARLRVDPEQVAAFITKRRAEIEEEERARIIRRRQDAAAGERARAERDERARAIRERTAARRDGELLAPFDAAERVRVSVQTIHHAIARGDLDSSDGRHVAEDALIDWAKARGLILRGC